MGKRSLRRRVLPECKGGKGSYLSDRISCLPDEILISILSLLPLDESARTCIISRRWKSLGIKYHRNLVFDGKRVKDSNKMVRQVNHVLRLHQGTIDGFSICFNFQKDSQDYLNKWLQLLSEKINGIKSFELDFSIPSLVPHSLQHWSENISLPCLPLAPFSSITYLSIKRLKASEKFVQGILDNCFLLENLCLAISEGVVCLKVSAKLLRLKYLDIIRWGSLEKVEVYAPNLSKFIYIHYGGEIELFFDNVLQLTYVSIGSYGTPFGLAVDPLSRSLSHVMTLSLQFQILLCWSLLEQPPSFPAMPLLNHLELDIVGLKDSNFLGWASLIVALPALRTLKTKFNVVGGYDASIRDKKPPRRHCSCLKTLEILGYQGYRNEYDFARYLVENAVELEKLVIGFENDYALVTEPRKHALQLKKHLRKGAKLYWSCYDNKEVLCD